MNAQLQAKLAVETNVEALRALVLIADSVIEAQAVELTNTREVLKLVHEELADVDTDADRYKLLKRSVRDMLVVAAYTGAQIGHRAVESFKKFDANNLDDKLDALIEAGVLDMLEEIEAEQEAAQSAQATQDDELVGYAAAGPAYRDELLPQGVLSDEY